MMIVYETILRPLIGWVVQRDLHVHFVALKQLGSLGTALENAKNYNISDWKGVMICGRLTATLRAFKYNI